MGGGDTTTLVAMMGDAYMSLDSFSTIADQQMTGLLPLARLIWSWSTSAAAQTAWLASGDVVKQEQFNEIRGSVFEIVREGGQAEILRTERPTWSQTAAAWRSFLASTTDRSFGGEPVPQKKDGHES